MINTGTSALRQGGRVFAHCTVCRELAQMLGSKARSPHQFGVYE